jgi:septum formation protein
MSSSPSVLLVLASASPRRRELLAKAGLAFEVRPADLSEEPLPGEAPRQLAERLAIEKALHVSRTLSTLPLRLVLGADTVVVLDGEALGKPDDAAHAVELLGRLVGRSHSVVTGVAVVRSDGGEPCVLSVESEVYMRAADEAEVRAYVATGESLDKAGAYAAQGEGRRFIERIVGSESNVIGLPMDETLALLREAGLALPRPAA